ncbi:MAG: lysophospholipase [Gammaproteobacteria bacterium]|nr:lysophospholipase [Gammaproteobacteria bacterium]
MRHTESAFAGSAGTRLYWQRWKPEQGSNAALVIVHGFGEHSGRYHEVATRLIDDGIAVYAFDLRGHGKSPGKRGHIDGINDYRGDIDEFLHLVATMEPALPIFLWGHSMGSLIALDCAVRNPAPLRSVITSAVGLEPAGVATPGVVRMARVWSRLLPKMPITIALDPRDLSRDADEVESYEGDPLVHNKATARWAASLLEEISWLKRQAPKIRMPIMMMHGDADPINLPMGSKRFMANVTYKDKSLKLYKGSLHVPHGDLDKNVVIRDLADWILAHSRKRR